MTFEIWMVLASVVVLFVHIGVQSISFTSQTGRDYNAGPRDENLQPTGVAGRARRAFDNFLETYPAFIALALAAVVSGGSDGLTQWGAGLYIAARLAYIPLYLIGIVYVRSLVWGLAALGLVLMGVGIVV